jgi:FkbM family methyltransferase
VSKRKKRIDLALGRGLAAGFIAASGALERPFVLIDVGARDGISPRWRPLAPAMEVYGFDAIADVAAPNERHHYFKIALGAYDGECRFHVPDNVYEAKVSPVGDHVVPMAKIDTLWAAHSLPAADFMKIDCEGHEPEILRGAEQYLAACDLLGAEIETNFFLDPTLPLSHFAAVNASLAKTRHSPSIACWSPTSASFRSSVWPGTASTMSCLRATSSRSGATAPPMCSGRPNKIRRLMRS